MPECEKLERADLDDLDRLDAVHRATQVVEATPEDVFATFEDAEAWTRWALPITEVEWTSPLPLTEGSTRTVTMWGDLVAEETFLVYERPHRMAFRFDRVSKPVCAAFAEDYRVTPVGDGRSVVDWAMAMSAAGSARRTLPLAAPLMGAGLRLMLRRLAREVEAR